MLLETSSVDTDVGLPEIGSSAIEPVCSTLTFSWLIPCRDGGLIFGKRSLNKLHTSHGHVIETNNRFSVVNFHNLKLKKHHLLSDNNDQQLYYAIS